MSLHPAVRLAHAFRALFPIAFWLCATTNSAGAVTQWSINELPTTTTTFQASQFRDWNTFPLQVTFTHQGTGQTFTVDGYWVGGNNWKVRYALPLIGVWNYAVSSPVNDPGFTQSGSITVDAPSAADISQNPNYRGHIKNNQTSRHFVYADGTPFFYLGDTNWRMNTRAGDLTFSQWTDDRKAKGFSVMQVAAFEIGQPNDSNKDAFEGGNWSALNFDHFPYLDTQFQELWNRGFVVAMHPMWITSYRN